MENFYFEMLDEPASDLVNKIECHLGAAIEIEIDAIQNVMACKVDGYLPKIITPSPNHFPSSSVFHELLHIRRFCVDSIPKIVVCDSFDAWTPELEDFFIELDNSIEHFIVVPEEIEKYEDRKEYWAIKIVRAIASIGMMDEEKEQKALCYWAFSNHVLDGSDAMQASNDLIQNLNLEQRAASFLGDIERYLNEKDKLVRVFFNHLNLSVEMGCLEYIDCTNRSSREEAIPVLTP